MQCNHWRDHKGKISIRHFKLIILLENEIMKQPVLCFRGQAS